MLERFLDPSFPSLKICGVTRADDAERLAELGVDALGANFWPKSKRFLEPEQAGFLRDFAGRILRVGVFVNAPTSLPETLFDAGLIDVVQLHGDEPESDIAILKNHGIPVIRAIGVKSPKELDRFVTLPSDAILLDAHAPGVYGGTGQTIDWNAVGDLTSRHPGLSVVLAGGITPENAEDAVAAARPCAVDVASGAESAPGIKDFSKVEELLAITTFARTEAEL